MEMFFALQRAPARSRKRAGDAEYQTQNNGVMLRRKKQKPDLREFGPMAIRTPVSRVRCAIASAVQARTPVTAGGSA